jgi:hypothetical protein
MYTSTVDTKSGHITVKTSSDNGEQAKFTAQLNGKEGHASLLDNLGNIIQINSTNGAIIVKNAAGSQFTIDGDTITLKAVNIVLDGNIKTTGLMKGPNATMDKLDCTTLHNVAIDQYKK